MPKRALPSLRFWRSPRLACAGKAGFTHCLPKQASRIHSPGATHMTQALDSERLIRACSQLVADVRARVRESERSAVPRQPVQGKIVSDEPVANLVSLATTQEFECRQQAAAKKLPSRTRCLTRRQREGDIGDSPCARSRQSRHGYMSLLSINAGGLSRLNGSGGHALLQHRRRCL